MTGWCWRFPKAEARLGLRPGGANRRCATADTHDGASRGSPSVRSHPTRKPRARMSEAFRASLWRVPLLAIDPRRGASAGHPRPFPQVFIFHNISYAASWHVDGPRPSWPAIRLRSVIVKPVRFAGRSWRVELASRTTDATMRPSAPSGLAMLDGGANAATGGLREVPLKRSACRGCAAPAPATFRDGRWRACRPRQANRKSKDVRLATFTTWATSSSVLPKRALRSVSA